MTVNPGYGGQKFIPEMFNKITRAKKIINSHKKLIELEVDGGINLENLSKVIDAGADIVVAGQTIFRNAKPEEIIKRMKAIIIESVKIN